MELQSELLRRRVDLGNLATGPIGTAAATVDVISDIGIAQTTAGQTFTLPAPTDAAANGRSVSVANSGTVPFTINGISIGVGNFSTFEWHNGTWRTHVGLAGSDFWRSGSITGALPDGVTDTQDAIFHNGQAVVDTNTAGDSGLTLDDLRSRNSTQLAAGDNGVTDINMTAIGVDISGKVRLSNQLSIPDIRATNPNPQDYAAGFSNVFKQSASIGMTGIYNVPTYVNLTTTRQYASGTDFSGGQVRQDVDFPDGRQYFRLGTGATTWGPWTLEGGCPGPMLRSALIALRDSGNLNVGCHYVINDFVQGRFLAGTTITMHADSAAELSMNATINTLYDNSGWACRYDIDTNNLLLVADNLGNVVESTVFARVASWDWGNAALTLNRIQGSVVLTYGNTNPVTAMVVANYANVDLTGRTGGTISDVYVQGQFTLANSNLTVLRSTIDTNSNIQATGYVGGGAGIVNTTIEGTSSIACNSATAGAVSITNCRVHSGANVSHTGAGTFTLTNTTVSDAAQIAHTSVGAFVATGAFFHEGSTAITHTGGPGAMTITSGEYGPYGRVSKTDPAATGATALNQCVVKSGGVILHQAAGNMTLTRFDLDSESAIDMRAGSNTALTGTYCKLSSGGNIAILASSTAGTMTLTNNDISSIGFIQKSGTGSLDVQSSTLTNASRISHTGARNALVLRCTMGALGYILPSSTGPAGVQDIVQYCDIGTGGSVGLSATGAAANTLTYCTVQGSASAINISGTSTGQSVTSNTVTDNSVLTIINSVACGVVYNSFRSNAIVQISGATAAQQMYYNDVSNGSTLSLTNNTVASSTQYNNIRSAGQLQISAASTAVQSCSIEQGTVSSTGGSLTRVKKSLSGTLVTATFTCSDIVHELNTNTTLTANNTARATRLGVTNTLPLI